MNDWTRRKFFFSTLAGGIVAGAQRLLGAPARQNHIGENGRPTTPDRTLISDQPQAASQRNWPRPVIISSANGYEDMTAERVRPLQKGMDVLKSGGDTLDAVVAAVTVVEDDPNDNSVGYGGLPNEEGEVELDACLMHGPTRRAGAVAGVRRIKNVAQLAKMVMERTNHVFLVGEGAQRFAIALGIQPMDLLTEKSRTAWLAWKARADENWAPGLDSPQWKNRVEAMLDSPEKKEWATWIHDVVINPPTGTIPCMAVNEKGEVSGVVTTSGLAWKIPGRVGDSGVIGAGMFCDGDVGAAGSTGRGEENIKISGSHTMVEMMRKGMSPQDACLEAMHRVIRNYSLRGGSYDRERLSKVSIQFYAINKDGQHGAATLWKEPHNINYAVHDGGEARLVPCVALLDRT